MAQDLGTGYILIQPSTKGLGKAIEDPLASAVQSASKSGGKTILSRIGGAFTSVGKIGLAAIGTIGGGLAALTAKGGFDRALNIERAQTRLKALGHDTQSVDAIMDDALNSVKGTAFGLGDAASAAATLVASGIQSGTQLQTVLGTVGDAAQIAGFGFKDMGVIFSQVAAKGKLQGDEMLQLMQAGIPVLQYLADHYGITTAAAQEMVSAGKVSFADFEAAMREHIGGAAQSAGESFDGMVGNVKAALSRLGEGFATPLINEATKLGGHVIPLIDQVAGSVEGLADTFAGRLSEAADSLAGILDGLNHDLEDGSLTMGDLAEQAGLLAGGMTVLAGVGGNVDGILSMFDQIGKAGDDGIRNLAAGLKKGSDDIGKSFDAIRTKIDSAKGYLTPSLREAMAIDGDPFANAINRIKQGGDQLASATDGIFKTIRTKITPGMANLAFKWENSGLYTGLTAAADGIKIKAGQLGDAITKGLGTAAGKINTSPLGTAITAIGNKTKPLFNKTIREAMTLDGDPFASALSKIGAKTSGFTNAITGKISNMATPFKTAFGNIFGGLGDAIGSPLQNAINGAGNKLQTGLNAIGGLVAKFFAPGNFMKFLGIGALAAALVAGVGMINSQMGGQLSAVINSAFVSLPDILSKAETWIQASLPQFVSSGAYIIEMVLQGVTGALPSLVSAGALLIDTIVTSLASHLPVIMPMAVNLVTTLVTSIIAAAPQLMSAGLTLLGGLLQGIVSSLPTLAAAIPQIITAIITALSTGLPHLMEQGVQMVLNLVNGVVSTIPQLAAQVPTIINTMVSGLTSNLPQIVEQGVQMIISLANGLMDALPQLLAQVPAIIANLVSTLASNLPQILQAGVQIIVSLAGGLVQAVPQLIGKIPSIISQITQSFTSVDWGSVGMNIIKGIGSGIASAAGSLVDAAVNAAKSAIDTVKGWLGIHSPSTRFRDEVGRMIGEGMAIGIRRETSTVSKAGSELARASMPASIPLPGFDESALRASVQETATRYLPVLNTAATASGYAPTAQGESIVTVNIDAQGTDPDVLYAMFETRTRAAIDKWGI